MTSFFLSIVVLDGEHATKLKRNRLIKLVLFLLSSPPIKIICIPEKLLSTMKVAFLPSPSSEKSHMKMKSLYQLKI